MGLAGISKLGKKKSHEVIPERYSQTNAMPGKRSNYDETSNFLEGRLAKFVDSFCVGLGVTASITSTPSLARGLGPKDFENLSKISETDSNESLQGHTRPCLNSKDL